MKKIRMPKSIIPKPSKIAKRGIFELIKEVSGENVKVRNYGKRVNKGKY